MSRGGRLLHPRRSAPRSGCRSRSTTRKVVVPRRPRRPPNMSPSRTATRRARVGRGKRNHLLQATQAAQIHLLRLRGAGDHGAVVEESAEGADVPEQVFVAGVRRRRRSVAVDDRDTGSGALPGSCLLVLHRRPHWLPPLRRRLQRAKVLQAQRSAGCGVVRRCHRLLRLVRRGGRRAATVARTVSSCPVCCNCVAIRVFLLLPLHLRLIRGGVFPRRRGAIVPPCAAQSVLKLLARIGLFAVALFLGAEEPLVLVPVQLRDRVGYDAVALEDAFLHLWLVGVRARGFLDAVAASQSTTRRVRKHHRLRRSPQVHARLPLSARLRAGVQRVPRSGVPDRTLTQIFLRICLRSCARVAVVLLLAICGV
mmetsp:Transcript_1621/g.3796  ORF Transcript_1621/g.3796 Transcript_1621/m.3796 type:complete len:367 (+) Transcript_1621:2919-4019(+)